MIRTEWNALRTGDRVLVHTPPFPAAPPQPGTVLRVTVRGRPANELAIELDGPKQVVCPALTTVHLDGESRSCWRCQELATPGHLT